MQSFLSPYADRGKPFDTVLNLWLEFIYAHYNIPADNLVLADATPLRIVLPARDPFFEIVPLDFAGATGTNFAVEAILEAMHPAKQGLLWLYGNAVIEEAGSLRIVRGSLPLGSRDQADPAVPIGAKMEALQWAEEIFEEQEDTIASILERADSMQLPIFLLGVVLLKASNDNNLYCRIMRSAVFMPDQGLFTDMTPTHSLGSLHHRSLNAPRQWAGSGWKAFISPRKQWVD